ncbi:hypothetical protein WR25_00698 [Diploscapter pachys]|uniref:Profilin n=1 Tax=Diploscapter pachys TaxID=2018661 RepID=A0A2A2LUF8_9BILA|nr:hypothetical protein WR25_00698 [Diploscapter pachys]
MAGWDAYINSLTGGSQAIKRAAIVGLDGSIWARTEGGSMFKATDSELKTFVSLFNNIDSVPSTGADLEGIHYIVPRTEPNLIFGKKDKSGFFAAKSKSELSKFSEGHNHDISTRLETFPAQLRRSCAVLIAVYEGENQVSADVRNAVEKLTTYLESIGY